MTGVAAEPGAVTVVEGGPPAVHRGRSALSRAGWFAASVLLVCVLWEAYKVVGSPDGG